MVGEVVSKYRILELLGAGAMGEVYKAQDTFLGRFVALKLLAEKYMEDRQIVLRFEREGMAAAALNHPNICTAYDSGQWRGRPYIAMEFLDGATLATYIKRGPIPPGGVLTIAIPVASALEAAHGIGIIHRDIKPANLFLTRRGVVKVLDFGLAKMKSRTTTPIGENAATIATFATLPGTVLGTLAYMAPEQFWGEAVDARADLYALGVVLYEALTGKIPVRGAPLADLPEKLGPIIRKLMEANLASRFQTAAELRAALESLREGLAKAQPAG
jgi:non-specific serine/threonine protein kinase